MARAKKQPTVKGSRAQIITTSVIIGVAALLTGISYSDVGFLPSLVVSGGAAVVAGISGIFLGIGIAKHRKAKKLSKSTVDRNEAIEVIEEQPVEVKVEEEKNVVKKEVVKKPTVTFDTFRQDELGKNTFAIYEADARIDEHGNVFGTLKRDVHNNRMIYRITNSDEYFTQLGKFILSETSSDCCIVVSDENNKKTEFDLVGTAYTRNIRDVVNKIHEVAERSAEMYPPVM